VPESSSSVFVAIDCMIMCSGVPANGALRKMYGKSRKRSYRSLVVELGRRTLSVCRAFSAIRTRPTTPVLSVLDRSEQAIMME
jgi:hypothetical protein